VKLNAPENQCDGHHELILVSAPLKGESNLTQSVGKAGTVSPLAIHKDGASPLNHLLKKSELYMAVTFKRRKRSQALCSRLPSSR
jgi:hypothetical protein